MLTAALLSVGLTSCAYVEMSGKMTKMTGEVMSDFGEEQKGPIGALASFGGKIHTAVGSTVEDIAREGEAGELEGSKPKQFIDGNVRVTKAAIDSVTK